MKKWIMTTNNENYILLHKSKEYKRYDKLPRVPNFLVWLMLKFRSKK